MLPFNNTNNKDNTEKDLSSEQDPIQENHIKEPGREYKKKIFLNFGSIKTTEKKPFVFHINKNRKKEQPLKIKEVLNRLEQFKTEGSNGVPLKLFQGEVNRIIQTRLKIYDALQADLSSIYDNKESFTSYTDCYIRLLPFHIFGNYEKKNNTEEYAISKTFENCNKRIKYIMEKYEIQIKKKLNRKVPLELQIFEQRLFFEEEKFLHTRMKNELEAIFRMRKKQ